MGKINKKALLFSLILTIVCAVVLFNYISTMKTPVENKPKTGVLLAARDILPGETIRDVDLKVEQVSTDSVPQGIITDKAKIINMIASERIMAGEPFRESRLSTIENMALSYNVPVGQRAITIFVSETTILSNMLRVGDHVDLITNFAAESDTQDYLRNTYTTIENVVVGAIGANRYSKSEAAATAAASQNNANNAPASTITLFVTPDVAERIVYAISYGEINLALRARGDEAPGNTEGVIHEEMVPDKAKTDLPDDVGSVVGQ